VVLALLTAPVNGYQSRHHFGFLKKSDTLICVGMAHVVE